MDTCWEASPLLMTCTAVVPSVLAKAVTLRLAELLVAPMRVAPCRMNCFPK